MNQTTWIPKGDGWVNQSGDTIHLVNPRGMKLYARLNDGDVRPEWYASLREARKGKHDE